MMRGDDFISLDSYVEAAKLRRTQTADVAGTVEEIERNVAAYFCNLVQHCFKKFRDDVGACEHCGSTDRLERAHRADCSRPAIVRRAILDTGRSIGEGRLVVSARALQLRFLDLHLDDDAGRRLLVLCKECHRHYDCRPAPTSVFDDTGAANPP